MNLVIFSQLTLKTLITKWGHASLSFAFTFNVKKRNLKHRQDIIKRNLKYYHELEEK